MDLTDYAYLWESGEWGLSHSHHLQARVVIELAEPGGSSRELVKLRPLLPAFRDRPMQCLREALRDARTHALEAAGISAARRMAQALADAGIASHLEDASYVSYQPVQGSPPQCVLLIEDVAIARAVTEEMLRRGVPVIDRSTVD
jgi:hypothetical protein